MRYAPGALTGASPQAPAVPLFADQFGVAQAAIVVRERPDDAVLDDQRLCRDPEDRRGASHEEAPRLRRRAAQGIALSWIVSLAIVGPCRERRPVAEHHRDAREGDIQLFRHDLRQSAADASTEVDMAAEGGDFARGPVTRTKGSRSSAGAASSERAWRRRPDHRKRPEVSR